MVFAVPFIIKGQSDVLLGCTGANWQRPSNSSGSNTLTLNVFNYLFIMVHKNRLNNAKIWFIAIKVYLKVMLLFSATHKCFVCSATDNRNWFPGKETYT